MKEGARGTEVQYRKSLLYCQIEQCIGLYTVPKIHFNDCRVKFDEFLKFLKCQKNHLFISRLNCEIVSVEPTHKIFAVVQCIYPGNGKKQAFFMPISRTLAVDF